MDGITTALKRDALGSCVLGERLKPPTRVECTTDESIPGFHRQNGSTISAEATLQIGDGRINVMKHSLLFLCGGDRSPMIEAGT
jgi:hypothetical protein